MRELVSSYPVHDSRTTCMSFLISSVLMMQNYVGHEIINFIRHRLWNVLWKKPRKRRYVNIMKFRMHVGKLAVKQEATLKSMEVKAK